MLNDNAAKIQQNKTYPSTLVTPSALVFGISPFGCDGNIIVESCSCCWSSSSGSRARCKQIVKVGSIRPGGSGSRRTAVGSAPEEFRRGSRTWLAGRSARRRASVHGGGLGGWRWISVGLRWWWTVVHLRRRSTLRIRTAAIGWWRRSLGGWIVTPWVARLGWWTVPVRWRSTIRRPILWCGSRRLRRPRWF